MPATQSTSEFFSAIFSAQTRQKIEFFTPSGSYCGNDNTVHSKSKTHNSNMYNVSHDKGKKLK